MVLPIFLGFFVGIVLALTGAGGAILSIPLLVFFLGLSIPEAAPVGLFALAVSASIAAVIGIKKGVVRYKTAALMAVLGMLLAPVGVQLSGILPVTVLSVLFALVLMFVGLRIVLVHLTYLKKTDVHNNAVKRTQMHRANHEAIMSVTNAEHEATDNPAPACQINPVTSRLFWTAPCTARLSLTGVVAGLLSGLLGVGGGFVIVPALRAVSNFNTATIIATSLTVVAFVSAAGFASYAVVGEIHWQLAISFAIGTLLGLLSVTSIADHIPNDISQGIFALLAIIIALKMLYQALRIFI